MEELKVLWGILPLIVPPFRRQLRRGVHTLILQNIDVNSVTTHRTHNRGIAYR